MLPAVRLLPFETLPGAANMAADEVMLHAAAAGGGASLRFYAWAEPTLSLGYFQPAADRLPDPKLAGLPWVRRASGGSALVHHHELTYALALPPGKPWQDPAAGPWACRFHAVVAAAVRRFGPELRTVVCGAEQKLGPVLCFLDQTPGDLLAAGAKVVGSAQRRQRGALLQHGGILLRRSDYTPTLPGLWERTGIEATPEQVATTVAEEFAAATGWELVAGDWTGAERAARGRVEAERYANPGWNGKR